jgi:hypothetical protein
MWERSTETRGEVQWRAIVRCVKGYKIEKVQELWRKSSVRQDRVAADISRRVPRSFA